MATNVDDALPVKRLTHLADTPASLGSAGQALTVNTAGDALEWSNSGGYDPGVWHVIGAAGEIQFQNGATAFGSGFVAPRYRKDSNNIVWLEGLIKHNDQDDKPLFTLPVGFRPAACLLWVNIGGLYTTISKTSVGPGAFGVKTPTAGGYCSLHISFLAEA